MKINRGLIRFTEDGEILIQEREDGSGLEAVLGTTETELEDLTGQEPCEILWKLLPENYVVTVAGGVMIVGIHHVPARVKFWRDGKGVLPSVYGPQLGPSSDALSCSRNLWIFLGRGRE